MRTLFVIIGALMLTSPDYSLSQERVNCTKRNTAVGCHGKHRRSLVHGYQDTRVGLSENIHPWAPKDLQETGSHPCVREGQVDVKKLICVVYWSQSERRNYRIGYYNVPVNNIDRWKALSIERESDPGTGLYERVGKTYDLEFSLGDGSRIVEVPADRQVAWTGSVAVAANPQQAGAQASVAPGNPTRRDCSRLGLVERVACEAETIADAIKQIPQGASTSGATDAKP